MVSISVDKQKVLGKTKPMHCINNLPTFKESDMTKLIEELGVPFVRLHDTRFVQEHLVDICCVFPDFDADENDPNSYDFAFTDRFMQTVESTGAKAFYRLGVSIENHNAIKTYYIYPPKDNLKWAKICEHIIMHYNEGWANGFHYGIEYWEIWNEPDNYPDIADNQMWAGTFKQYLELYKVSSTYLKEKFPSLKIGGYASCGFYDILEQKSVEHAHVSTRTGYFVDCFIEFLEYAKANNLPLDFFSWHSYGDVFSNVKFSEFAREKLNAYGFTKTESILNEWNPNINIRGTLEDASNITANMLALHNAGMDMLMYYDFRICTYNGAINPITYKPFKGYYSFYTFNELYQKKNRVYSDSDDKNVFVSSACDGADGVLTVTNNSKDKKKVKISGIKVTGAKLVSEKTDFGEIKAKQKYTLKPFEVLQVYYK